MRGREEQQRDGWKAGLEKKAEEEKKAKLSSAWGCKAEEKGV